MRRSHERKPAPARRSADDQRVWYLLLPIGVPRSGSREVASQHSRVVAAVLQAIGIERVRRMQFRTGRGTHPSDRYLFRFGGHRKDDASAVRLAEAFLYGMSLVDGPIPDVHADPLVLPLPMAMVGRKRSLLMGEVVALEESKSPEDRWLRSPVEPSIGRCLTAPSETHEEAWRIAAVTFGNEALFDAVRFLTRSQNNFCVSPDDLREVLDKEEAVARTSFHQTDLEEALQNAFKAIEAAIGDPSKDDRKLHKRLRDIGIDPQMEEGHGQKLTIPVWIRRMNKARDKYSAHGSTRPRTIRILDMLNFQECARLIVLSALNNSRAC